MEKENVSNEEVKETKKKHKNNGKMTKNILIIGFFVILVVVFIFLINLEDPKVSRVDKKNINMFNSSMLDTYVAAKTMDYEAAKQFIMSETYDAAQLYGGIDGVDYSANYILSILNTDVSGNVEDLISKLTQETNNVIDDVLNGDIFSQEDDGILRNSLSLKSNTVCAEEDIDNKFCVENLNARTYIVDENSDKWAVIIHPFMTSGSIMYMAVGEMYTSQGFNVVAPNLRGFGGSSGSVAMGYLESLDVYDWFKDLNENYSRYGVTKAPETIVVHGMSLGAATTLQLATNPDIAAAQGAPYTKNLTQLHVKGFVDDCGYTSMTGIITGMLTMGDMTQITSMLGSLGIDEAEFMKEFSQLTEKLNIEGFEKFNFSTEQIKNFDTIELLATMQDFVTKFNELETQFSQIENGNPNVSIPGLDQSAINALISKYSQYDWESVIQTIPQMDGGHITSDVDWSKYISAIQPKITDTSSVTNGLISEVLREIIGVGLTEENYDKYSNSFSEGRHFPAGSKVMIIHGTGDTMVPHNNADIVAANVANGVLLHKWDVPAAPHAFVLMGMNKDNYSSLVNKFTACVLDANCNSIN